MRHPSCASLSAACLIAMLACATSSNAVSMGGALYTPRTTTLTRAPGPSSLGQRDIAAATRKNAALNVADSVVRALGWTVTSIIAERSELRTDWLYIQGPT